ncbi:endonuclease domain-containing protein [Streptomyces anulatus]|uniref:endonuclease domain-containing protein n=1 Tax=Streptomyces anulatus TaxID=1892 RepID=UPI0033C5973F
MTRCPPCSGEAFRPYTGHLRGVQYETVRRRTRPDDYLCHLCKERQAAVWDHCHEHGHVRAGALQELRTALLLPGYRTRRAAALTLGIPRTSLNWRLKKLETAAGFAIFNHRKRPVAATARGQALLDEAQLLLQRLDHDRPQPPGPDRPGPV